MLETFLHIRQAFGGCAYLSELATAYSEFLDAPPQPPQRMVGA